MRLTHARCAARYCASLVYYTQIVCQSPLSAATLRALSPPPGLAQRPHERERCEAVLAAVRACRDSTDAIRDSLSAHVGLTLTFMKTDFARALDLARSRGRAGAALRLGAAARGRTARRLVAAAALARTRLLALTDEQHDHPSLDDLRSARAGLSDALALLFDALGVIIEARDVESRARELQTTLEIEQKFGESLTQLLDGSSIRSVYASLKQVLRDGRDMGIDVQRVQPRVRELVKTAQRAMDAVKVSSPCITQLSRTTIPL